MINNTYSCTGYNPATHVLSIQVCSDADPSSGLCFVFHFAHHRLFIRKLKSIFKNKSWHISPLSLAVQFMCSTDKTHYEYVQDQEVLMKNISRSAFKKKQPGVSGAFMMVRRLENWNTSEQLFLSQLQWSLPLKIRTSVINQLKTFVTVSIQIPNTIGFPDNTGWMWPENKIQTLNNSQKNWFISQPFSMQCEFMQFYESV